MKLDTAKVTDSASSLFKLGPKLQRERITGHKFETTLSFGSKVASQYYECEDRVFCQEMPRTAKKTRENTKLARERKSERTRKIARSQVEPRALNSRVLSQIREIEISVP